MNPFFVTDFSISDSLKTVRKSVLIYETIIKDGTLFFQADYTNRENLITWLLTFRDKVELLQPEAVREELRQSILQIAKKYDQATNY